MQVPEDVLDGRAEAHLEELVSLVENKGVEVPHVSPQAVILHQIKEPGGLGEGKRRG